MYKKNTTKKKELSQKRKDFLEAIKYFKRKQTKNKRHSKETLGTLQTYNQNYVGKFLLHLPENWFSRFGLAYGAHVAEGKSWGIVEIRTSNITAPVLQLQHEPRRDGGRVLRPNGKRNRLKTNGKIRST